MSVYCAVESEAGKEDVGMADQIQEPGIDYLLTTRWSGKVQQYNSASQARYEHNTLERERDMRSSWREVSKRTMDAVFAQLDRMANSGDAAVVFNTAINNRNR